MGGAPDSATPDPEAAYFEPDEVLEVAIEMPAAAWDALRFQGRNVFDVFGDQDCQAEPFGSPFTYFPADVTIDGEKVTQAGVRKKGFLGSLSSDKPSLKISLDEFVQGQRLHGVERFTLNNAKQDASYLNQCLTYRLFADAELPSPRCNFAHVTLNGQDLGVYVHVEAIKKPFLRRFFPDDEGNLYEGTLSDFRAGWEGTFERKTNERSDPSRADLSAVTAALETEGDLETALAPFLDLDSFYRFWAMESLTAHWDGYTANTNNFYLYADPASGRFFFIPWGADQTFLNGENPDPTRSDRVPTQGVLAHRLFSAPSSRARYLRVLEQLLDEVWDAQALGNEIARMRALIDPLLMPEEVSAVDEGVGRLQQFVSRREAETRRQIAGMPTSVEPLRDSMCLEPVGDVSGSFTTEWNSLDNDAVDPRGFTGELAPTVMGLEYSPQPLGLAVSVAGLDPDQENPALRAAILVLVQQLDETMLAVIFHTHPDNLNAGTLQLDFESTRGLLARIHPDDRFELLGILAEGQLTLEAAGTANAAPIRGSFQTRVFDPGFLVGHQ